MIGKNPSAAFGRNGFRSQRLHNKSAGPAAPSNPPVAAEVATDIHGAR
jgi:hypothetical protein